MMLSNQWMSRLIATMLFCVITCTAVSQQVLPQTARFAFVNDGYMVLGDDAGSLYKTKYRAMDVNISADGTSVVFTGSTLLKKVIPFSKQYPKYGTATAETGIYRLSLESGRVEQLISYGSNPQLSPDNAQLAFSHHEAFYCLNLATGKLSKQDSGDQSAWLAKDSLVIGRNFQFTSYRTSGEHEILAPTHDLPIGAAALKDVVSGLKSAFDDLNRALEDLKAGRSDPSKSPRNPLMGRTYHGDRCLQPLVTHDGVSFGRVRVGMDDNGGPVNKCEAFLCLSNGSIYDVEICHDQRSNSLQDVAFCPDRSCAAIVFQEHDIQRNPPGDVCLAHFGEAIDQRKKSEGDCVLEHIITFPDVSRVEFLDKNTLLVEVIDPSMTRITLSDGAVIIIGTRQLEPDVLKIMDLPVRIADADSIYKVDIATKRATKLSSGHGIVVR